MPLPSGHAPSQSTPQRPRPSSLWRFSLEFYRRPGVADACVALQDAHGVDVNLLLCLLWLAGAHRQLHAAQVAALDARIAEWRSVAVLPLRALRRSLKGSGALSEPDAIEALRTRVKALELEAERLEQDELQALASTIDARAGAACPRDAASANLAAYASVLGRELDARRVAALLAAMAPAPRDESEP